MCELVCFEGLYSVVDDCFVIGWMFCEFGDWWKIVIVDFWKLGIGYGCWVVYVNLVNSGWLVLYGFGV